jgi:hypothetical protein
MLDAIAVAGQEVPATPREHGGLARTRARLHGDVLLRGVGPRLQHVELPRVRRDAELFVDERFRALAPAEDALYGARFRVSHGQHQHE